MSLITDLSKAVSEEDVKDAYIKALSLKSFKKGLADDPAEEVAEEVKTLEKTADEVVKSPAKKVKG